MNVTENGFHGVWVALVTPWNIETRALRHREIQTLIDKFVEAEVTGLYILGTTGEGTLLTVSEREEFAEAVLDAAAGKIPVIVHTGHDRTEAACTLSRHAARIGAAAVAVAPPCRYRFTQGELRAHYLEIAHTVGDLPLFLYDIPATTGNPLGADLLTGLHVEAPNVVGAKVSRGDWDAWEEYLHLGNEFTILIGTDEMGLSLLVMGGSGLVSSCANILPRLYAALYRAATAADYAAGREIQNLITELCRATRRGHVPTIKRALSLMGWDVGPPVPPLRAIPIEEDTQLRAQLAAIEKQATNLIGEGGDS